MSVAGQEMCVLVLRGGIDDGICDGQLMFSVQVCSEQGDGGVQRDDSAVQRLGEHLIGSLLADFVHQPFGEFELNDGWYHALRLVREVLAPSFSAWLPVSHSIHADVSTTHNTAAIRTDLFGCVLRSQKKARFWLWERDTEPVRCSVPSQRES